ncbi:MAG: hypothetical protein CSB49_04005 [Proteobacteria bacterium]|nr:MAG: hypothetical protein CSB49_04005 [Pseudomonadota bacterium]
MATNDSNKTQGVRDTGFGCPHYEAVLGKKRCRHYLDGGSCARPDEFMCVEWLRLNRSGRSTASCAKSAEVDEQRAVNKKAKPAPKPKGFTDLFGNPVPEPKKPKRTTPTQQRPTAATPSPSPVVDDTPEEREPLRGLTTDDIEGFKKLGVEVCLESEVFGEVWLVPEYTGADRKEITPEHTATIARVMEAFPGSKVVSFEKSPKPDKEAE